MKTYITKKNFIGMIVSIIFTLIIFLPLGNVFHVSAESLDDVLKDAGVRSGEQKVPLPKVQNKNTSEKKVNYIIYKVIKIFLIVSGVIAVTFIVLGGVEYTISAGEEDRLNGAKSKIKYALFGLLVVIFSYAILTNVINFLEISE